MAQKAAVFEFLLNQQRTAINAVAGGWAYFYEAGAGYPSLKDVWLDRDKNTLASNPYQLDANGKAQIYGDGNYRIVVKDASGVTVEDWDNITVIDYLTAGGYQAVDGDYASLSAAVTAIGSTPTTLTIKTANYPIGAPVTVPSTLRLSFLPPGSIAQGTDALIVDSEITAGAYQIFSGTGSLTLNAVSKAYPQWTGCVCDGTTDDTVALQRLNDALSPGATISLQKGDCKFTTLNLTTGVDIVAEGGRLYSGTVYFGYTAPGIGNTHNSTVSGWFKQCHFDLHRTDDVDNPYIDNGFVADVHFVNATLDGTGLNDTGSASGTAVFIGQLAFNTTFTNVRMNNYTNGVVIQGNSATDLSGTAFLGTGVSTYFTDVNINNMGWGSGGKGIQVIGSCKDGLSLHMSNVLLDHCGIGLDLHNERSGGAGELTVLGSNVRLEWNDQAVRNDSQDGLVSFKGVWAYAPPGVDRYIENVTGNIMMSDVRGTADSGKYMAYNALANDSRQFTISGIYPESAAYNVISPIYSDESSFNQLRVLRFGITAGAAGKIKVKFLNDGTLQSYGGNFLDTTQSADIASGGTASVGSGISAITYGFTTGTLSIALAKSIGRVVSGTLSYQLGSLGIVSVAVSKGGGDSASVSFNKADGTNFDLSTLTGANYIEFTLFMAQ
jgi:hypothetical protein